MLATARAVVDLRQIVESMHVPGKVTLQCVTSLVTLTGRSFGSLVDRADTLRVVLASSPMGSFRNTIMAPFLVFSARFVMAQQG